MEKDEAREAVIEERRRQAQAVAAERSKALTESYRRPFGADEPTPEVVMIQRVADSNAEVEVHGGGRVLRCHDCPESERPATGDLWDAVAPLLVDHLVGSHGENRDTAERAVRHLERYDGR